MRRTPSRVSPTPTCEPVDPASRCMGRPPAPDVVMPVAPTRRGASGRSLPVALLVSLRPEQWTKNAVLFAGLLFGMQLRNPVALSRALLAFVVFCALSGVVYLLNDIADCEADRRHPLKCRRPVACGELPVAVAATAAAVIAAVALGV